MTFDFRKELEKFDLTLSRREYRGNSSDPDDYEPIDFTIQDKSDDLVWVWGSHPTDDVAIECWHPDECIEWGDDDERGVCQLCGAECDWHYEDDVVDEGHDEEGDYTAKAMQIRVPDCWILPLRIGGLVGKYLRQMARKW